MQFQPLLPGLLLWAGAAAAGPLPEHLSDTGLYAPGTRAITENLLPFAPQYPLWSDGAHKQRWLYLPPGRFIDATNPDAWEFPPGTRVWKEFGYQKPVETRMIERLEDGSWRFAAYVWAADASDATLAPEYGIPRHPAPEAPGGVYPIPSTEDCLACHDGGAGPLLGISALQLSPDRDPMAPHAEQVGTDAVDLLKLHDMGLLRNLPQRMLQRPPRIAASTARGRAALGYLHGNCGVCHNDRGSLADLDLVLLQSSLDEEAGLARILETLVGYEGEAVGDGLRLRVKPGDSASSVVSFRMLSRNPVTRMPPLGRRIPDLEAVALIEKWIQNDFPIEKEHP